jgi:DNA-binding LacI/PurR family transcriptional regulator
MMLHEADSTLGKAIDRIQELIRTENLPPGGRLPSERELSRKWNLNRAAVSEAVACLIARGRVRREGYRLYVTLPSPDATPGPIHVVHPGFPDASQRPHRLHIIEAAHDVAARLGSHTIPVFGGYPRHQREQILEVAGQGSNGLLVWPQDREIVSSLVRARSAGVPVVVLDQDFGDFDTVSTDNEAGARLAVEHLYRLGHRHIAYVTEPVAPFPSLQRRLVGYEHACLSFGLTRSAKRVFELSHYPEPAPRAEKLVAQIRHDEPSVTAVFCSNDVLALPMLRAAQAAGLRVPGDWSIIGFDNDDFGAVCSPALTTIAQDFYRLGVLGAELLFSRLRPTPPVSPLPDRPIKLRLEPYLVERHSTGRP